MEKELERDNNTGYTHDIAKMITVSTCHIRRETAEEIDELIEKGERPFGLVIYPKGEYGWFIYVSSEEYRDESEDIKETPDDLTECIMLAKKNGCVWLAIDRDGEEDPSLTSYEW